MEGASQSTQAAETEAGVRPSRRATDGGSPRDSSAGATVCVASGGRSSKWPRSPRRIALAALGVACVGLAGVGVVVPGLPTTVFLIVASYLFARSCPWLEDRLVRVPWFRPYLRFLDGNHPMPRRARVMAMGMMWLAVSASLLLTAVAGALQAWFAVTVLGAAAVGTLVIFRIRRAFRR